MIKTKTFSQIIDDGYTYPTIIPPDLQAVIYDWYQFRHVCDNDKFGVMFSRLLRSDYEQYKQLLRIEPGIAQYDWLVSQYHELQRVENGNEQSSNMSSKSGQNTLTKSFTHAQEKTDGQTDTIIDRENGEHSIQTNAVGSKTHSNTTSITQDDTTDVTNSENTSTESSGHTDGSNQVTEKYNDKAMTRALPMQISQQWIDPTSGLPMTAVDLSDVKLDWSTASQQDGKGHTGTNNTVSLGTTRNEGSTDLDGSSHTVYDGDGHEESQGTDTSRDESTVAHITQNRRDGSVSKQRRINDSYSDSETGRGNNSSTDTGSASGMYSNNAREIMTGRNAQIANILDQAMSFIVKSNAWEWFMTRLDTCFMGVYDV